MYVLTGSEAYSLMNGITQSMSGRVTIINLPPLSLKEILGLEETPFLSNELELANKTIIVSLTPQEIFEKIVQGFYPEVKVNKEIDHQSFYSDYIETYINRNVCKISNIVNILSFYKF